MTSCPYIHGLPSSIHGNSFDCTIESLSALSVSESGGNTSYLLQATCAAPASHRVTKKPVSRHPVFCACTMVAVDHLGLPLHDTSSTALTSSSTVSFHDDDDTSATPSSTTQHTKKRKKTGGFQSFNLLPFLFKGVMKLGYQLPTPVQRRTIPLMMGGQDVIVMARTGSGKTAAFLIPTLQHLASHPPTQSQPHVRAVILSPTRELALQTHTFCLQLLRFFPSSAHISLALLTGGSSMAGQFESLTPLPQLAHSHTRPTGPSYDGSEVRPKTM